MELDSKTYNDFTFEGLSEKTIKSLVDIVLSQNFASEGYLEAIRFYFNTIYNNTEKPLVPSTKQIGRNEPCPCNSGKKYKKCCLNKVEEEDLENALKRYDKLIASKPNSASNLYNRGRTQYILGQYEEAIQDYDRAIFLNPTYHAVALHIIQLT